MADTSIVDKGIDITKKPKKILEYNKRYERSETEKKFEVAKNSDELKFTDAYKTEMLNASNYRSEKEITNLKDNLDVGYIFGNESNCRSNTLLGDVTKIGGYSYNHGTLEEKDGEMHNSNSPAYKTDKEFTPPNDDITRMSELSTVNGYNLFQFREQRKSELSGDNTSQA